VTNATVLNSRKQETEGDRKVDEADGGAAQKGISNVDFTDFPKATSSFVRACFK